MPSLFLLLGALVGLATFTLSGVASIGFALVTQLQQRAEPSSLHLMSLGWISLAMAALLVPAAIVGGRSLRRGPERPLPLRVNHSLVLLALLIPLTMAFAGWLAYRNPITAMIIVPPAQLIIIGVFAWVIYKLARRGIEDGTQRRRYGVHTFGLLALPMVTIAVEMMVILVLVVAFVVWLLAQPELVAQLAGMQDHLQELMLDEEALEQFVAPFINNPWLAVIMILVVGGIMPVIEELLKPLAVWLMRLRGLSENEGYLYGLISGLAFGVFESFGMMANVQPGGEEWLTLVASRSVTTVLHMATTALVGWGIGGLGRNGGWGRLARKTLLAIGIHSAWNSLGVILGLYDLGATAGWIQVLGKATPYLLALLLVFMLGILYGINRHLRQKQARG